MVESWYSTVFLYLLVFRVQRIMEVHFVRKDCIPSGSKENVHKVFVLKGILTFDFY